MEKKILDLTEATEITENDYTLLETNQGTKKVKATLLKSSEINFDNLVEVAEVTEDTYTLVKTNNGNKKIKTEKIKNNNCLNFNNITETSFNENEYMIVGSDKVAKKIKLSTLKNNLSFDINTTYSELKTNNKTILGAINELLNMINNLKKVEPPIVEPPITDDEIESIIITPSTSYSYRGDSVLLEAKVIPESALDKYSIEWSSSDEGSATVFGFNKTRADVQLDSFPSQSMVEITATCGGKFATSIIHIQ